MRKCIYGADWTSKYIKNPTASVHIYNMYDMDVKFASVLVHLCTILQHVTQGNHNLGCSLRSNYSYIQASYYIDYKTLSHLCKENRLSIWMHVLSLGLGNPTKAIFFSLETSIQVHGIPYNSRLYQLHWNVFATCNKSYWLLWFCRCTRMIRYWTNFTEITLEEHCLFPIFVDLEWYIICEIMQSSILGFIGLNSGWIQRLTVVRKAHYTYKNVHNIHLMQVQANTFEFNKQQVQP
jgi:hypothetical protein